MAYLTIKQVKEQYSVADKTIRRLYEGKTISRSQGYKNRKGRWLFNSDYIQAQFPDKIKDQPAQRLDPEPATSQQASSGEVEAILREQIQLLKDQVSDYKQSNNNLNNTLVALLGTQQSLVARLDRLELAAPAPEPEPIITNPPEPITATKAKPSNKAQPIRKKPVKQPKKPSSDTKKTSKPKRWWRR